MVQIGLPPYRAAEACNVSRQVYFVWARKGGHPDSAESQDWVPPDEADPIYRDFIAKVLATEAASVHQVTETCYQKAQADGEFGLKFLKHRWPEEWNPNRKQATTVVVQDSPPIQMTAEEYMKARQQMREEGHAAPEPE
jgi:hypothetical protein